MQVFSWGTKCVTLFLVRCDHCPLDDSMERQGEKQVLGQRLLRAMASCSNGSPEYDVHFYRASSAAKTEARRCTIWKQTCILIPNMIKLSVALMSHPR